ncbi:MAG: CRISPR-associated protein Cas4 [Chloroflexi bacterium]|nr:CRISPR-associated protein Cas4 [Chloroflexota bacterium]
MFTEDDLLPISALQHLTFCERQWGLIHLEGAWQDNVLTVEGTQLHDRAHDPDTETEVRGNVRTARGLRLRSLQLGLTGMADVVEFHAASELEAGIQLEGAPGLWQPFIVEYKRGHPKIGREDEVQLCAQALCLEEMLGVSILSSAFFYGEPRRRSDVVLDQGLRQETEALVARLHELTRAGATPPAQYAKKCNSCSLVDLCLPRATGGQRSAQRYLARAIADVVDPAPIDAGSTTSIGAEATP